jgi:hypothetical protein
MSLTRDADMFTPVTPANFIIAAFFVVIYFRSL